MKELTLFDTQIKVTDDGLISLTDMYKAAELNGKTKRHHRPVDFLRIDSTKIFIDELSKGGLRPPLKIIKGKQGGTYVSKFIAYKYAAYLDPAFEVGVYQVVDKFFSGEIRYQPQQELHDFAIRESLSIRVSSEAGRLLNKRKYEKALLEQEKTMLEQKYQIKIEFAS